MLYLTEKPSKTVVASVVKTINNAFWEDVTVGGMDSIPQRDASNGDELLSPSNISNLSYIHCAEYSTLNLRNSRRMRCGI